MKKYNLSVIMRRAWALIKTENMSRAEAMRQAWHEAKSESEEYEIGCACAEIVKAWHEMPEKAQHDFVAKCVVKSARNYIGRSVEDQYDGSYELPAFYLRPGSDELEEIVNEAFCTLIPALTYSRLYKLQTRRAENGKELKTLVSIVYAHAYNAIERAQYARQKHGRACVRVVTDHEGVERSAVETLCSSADDVANASALKIALAQFLTNRDDTDKTIVDCLAKGMNQTEIAAAVDMSQQAVSKRIKSIRADLKAALA